MSREDPQFKLRMPVELRAQAEQAARSAGRSLNSELVARIESSFLGENSVDSLMGASRARELAIMARKRIPDQIRNRAIDAISKAVKLGHSEALVQLDDLKLDSGIPDKDLDDLLAHVIDELQSAGYNVKWDDITALWIEF